MLSEKDRELVKKLLDRDEAALRSFYLEYKKPLLNFILAKIAVTADAEEVVQDTFLAFIESLRDFRGNSSLKTFLYAIAKRKAIDKLRKRKFKRILFSHFPEGIIESFATVLMDPEIDRIILAKKIEVVLKTLPNDYARVLRLKYRDGYKVSEIAERVNLSFKATESLIFRARKAFVETYRST